MSLVFSNLMVLTRMECVSLATSWQKEANFGASLALSCREYLSIILVVQDEEKSLQEQQIYSVVKLVVD